MLELVLASSIDIDHPNLHACDGIERAVTLQLLLERNLLVWSEVVHYVHRYAQLGDQIPVLMADVVSVQPIKGGVDVVCIGQ